MKYATFCAAYAAILGLAIAEVPQEHSHQSIINSVNSLLKLNNPNNIQDAIFGLLGNKAAAEGAGKITNLDCLHQATADQAFSNAKAANDVQGQSDALVYAALERNTGSVGLKSVLCTDKAVNPEIQAIQQHQDPASDGAAATNKGIALEVAKQIASIGGNPNDAIQSGTFAPGKIGDPTAKGNTCDVADDAKGCIISQNLLVPDVSAAEIKSAVAGANKQRSLKATRAVNVNAFSGTLGTAAVPIESTAGSDRPFSVNGATFINKGAAVQRACDVQNNACFNAANSGKLAGGTAQCDTQHTACLAANGSKKLRKARKITKLRRAALDLGSCSNPAIAFGAGFDGRKEDSFEPADKAEFSHGSALNIKVISGFICSQLQSKCKAGADAVTACNDAASAANNLKGQAAADAFNSALGVSA